MKQIQRLCICCLWVWAAGTLCAQTVSPLKEATAGLFGAESDNITSTTSWNRVFFDKALVTASYGYDQNQNDSTGTGILLNTNVLNTAAMFNMKKSDILGGKIGISYVGGLGNGMELSANKNGGASITKKNLPFFHKLGFLIGLPGNKFGLRVGFDVGGTYNDLQQSPQKETSKITNTLSFKPSLEFGASIPTRNRYVFTPTAEVAVLITNGGGAAAGAYSSGSVKGIGSDGKPYEDTRIFHKYMPSGSVGIGIAFPSKLGITSWSSSFKYAFSYTHMPKKYERKITAGVLEEALYRPDRATAHTLSAQVTQTTALSWRLSLKAAVSLSANYRYELDGGSVRHTLTAKSPVQTTESHLFTLIPVISTGITYKISDNVLWFGAVAFRPLTYSVQQDKLYNEKVAVAMPQNTVAHTVGLPLLTHLGTGLNFQLSGDLGISCAVMLKPSETAPVRTLQDLFGTTIRLGVTWKDSLKQ